MALVREMKGSSPMNHMSRPVNIITSTAPGNARPHVQSLY
ncbi:hypothetical protein SVIRM249S_06907 [Streptomyces viridochromogenes]